MLNTKLAVAVVGATLVVAGAAEARDQIRIVGSSTVFPFSTAVAETFGRSTQFKTPVVEPTGTGGGLEQFCAGVGVDHPDIANASRRIKSSEFENCTANGVDLTEVKIGYDGIVLANANAGPKLDLSKKQIFLALAKQVPGPEGELIDNPNEKWSDIDPSLPDTKIEVLGPPPTSGTRDAFVELAMEEGAKEIDSLKALSQSNKDAFKAVAHRIREDLVYVEAGENDNVIVQKLEANPNAVGIFGFSFLDQNPDMVKGATIGGVEPTFDNIASGDYGISRSLYFYVKKPHVGVIPGMQDFVAEFTSARAWGPDGYLAEKGLIPLSDEERKAMQTSARNMASLAM